MPPGRPGDGPPDRRVPPGSQPRYVRRIDSCTVDTVVSPNGHIYINVGRSVPLDETVHFINDSAIQREEIERYAGHGGTALGDQLADRTHHASRIASKWEPIWARVLTGDPNTGGYARVCTTPLVTKRCIAYGQFIGFVRCGPGHPPAACL